MRHPAPALSVLFPNGDVVSEPAYLKDLRSYGGGDPTQDNIKSVEREMFNGPDRGAALVLASLVEKALEKLLRNSMRPTGVSTLFKYGAPLGDFSSKIEMAHALNLIGSKTYNDLTIIRIARNQFAHCRKAIRFTTPVVKTACSYLQLPDEPGVHLSFNMLNKVKYSRLRQASDKNHPRTRFFTSCNEIAQRIYYIRTGKSDDPLNQLP